MRYWSMPITQYRREIPGWIARFFWAAKYYLPHLLRKDFSLSIYVFHVVINPPGFRLSVSFLNFYFSLRDTEIEPWKEKKQKFQDSSRQISRSIRNYWKLLVRLSTMKDWRFKYRLSSWEKRLLRLGSIARLRGEFDYGTLGQYI